MANNLNDISKDHPHAVTDLAARWWAEGDENRRELVRHALRSLVKAGHPEALEILGFGSGSPARVVGVFCHPRRVAMGETVGIELEVENPSGSEAGALVDLRVHFVKANGGTSPRVFKGARQVLGPGEALRFGKSVSLPQLSTRRHYPGSHRVEVLLNGRPGAAATFQLEQGRFVSEFVEGAREE